MAVWTYEETTEYSFPNITIYKRLRDGVQTDWRINANEGYVFKDTTENNLEYNPETGENEPVISYYKLAYLPLNYNFENFSFEAVLESEAF